MPTKRYIRHRGSAYISSYIKQIRKRKSASQQSNASSISAVTSNVTPAAARRELIINVERMVINVATPAAPVVPSQRPRSPVRADSPVTALPPPRPANAPIPPRRRHALIPRRVTYQSAINIIPENLEALCESPFSCGRFTDTCLHCGAKFFTKEPKNRQGVRLSCCKNGLVSIPLPGCPSELRPLYTEHTESSNEFLANIRVINSLFAMASFKTSAPNQRVVEGQGRWCFGVCGQIYHYTVGVPTSQELRQPVLAHYYFLDAAEILDRRNDFLEDRLRRETVEKIERILRRQ